MKPPTDAELGAAGVALSRLFEAINRSECPLHGPTTLVQRGHCVYGACGCRLFAGKLSAWKPLPERAR